VYKPKANSFNNLPLRAGSDFLSIIVLLLKTFFYQLVSWCAATGFEMDRSAEQYP
jgi:hypothetical protein